MTLVLFFPRFQVSTMRFHHAPVSDLRRNGNTTTVKTFTSNGNNSTIRTNRKYSTASETSNQNHHHNEHFETSNYLNEDDLANDLMTHDLTNIRHLSDTQSQSQTEDIAFNQCVQSVNDNNYNNQIDDCGLLNNLVNHTPISLNIDLDNTDSIREIGRNNSFYAENSPDDSFMDEEGRLKLDETSFN